MNFLDILYTPLDIPDRPNIDLEKFQVWAKSVYPQEVKEKSDGSTVAEKILQEKYPWDLTFGHFGPSWKDRFNELFPEIARYSWEAFGLKEEWLQTLVFLPVREKVRGELYWHSDVDETGLRFYIENEEPEKNPLLVKATCEPYNTRPNIGAWPADDDPRLQKESYICKMISPHQAYFLNNIRAVHTPTSTVPSTRIAAFITVHPVFLDQARPIVQDLVIRSAKKFKEQAVLWTPPR